VIWTLTNLFYNIYIKSTIQKGQNKEVNKIRVNKNKFLLRSKKNKNPLKLVVRQINKQV